MSKIAWSSEGKWKKVTVTGRGPHPTYRFQVCRSTDPSLGPIPAEPFEDPRPISGGNPNHRLTKKDPPSGNAGETAELRVFEGVFSPGLSPEKEALLSVSLPVCMCHKYLDLVGLCGGPKKAEQVQVGTRKTTTFC